MEPFFPEPPHARDPSGKIAVWYTEPAGVVLQLLESCEGTLEMAQWIAGPNAAETRRRFPAENGELIVVFDMRALTGRDPAARATVIEMGKTMRSRVKRIVLLPPRTFSPTLRRTMEVTLALLKVFGLNIDVAQGPGYVLAETRLRPLPLTAAGAGPHSKQ
ncbi:MAG TPA: hypothetical protein VHM19_03050 [Polyangiales bacterium]|nr:hypothetical protein [Polyangiales bacterium]